MLQVVPLTNDPNQSLTVSLTVDGQNLVLKLYLHYSEMCGYWIMSISDEAGNLLVDSIPLITGSAPAANLLEQQAYLGIGSWYVINISNVDPVIQAGVGFGEGGFGEGGFGGGGSNVDYPNRVSLGTDYQLWVGDTP